MNIKQVREYFENKRNVACPFTERLIQAGYQQTSGGYIKKAHLENQEVDYRKAEPNQWWHLIRSYCDNVVDDKKFTKQIQCGELLFWMAEVSGCASKKELEEMLERIQKSGKPFHSKHPNKPNVRYDRKYWNKEIQNQWFDKIVKIVEAASKEMDL